MLLAVGLSLVLVAGIALWVVVRDGSSEPAGNPSDTTAGEEVSEGPVTVRYPAAALPGGRPPTVELKIADDEFLAAFAVPGTEKVVAHVTAAAQPTAEVEIAFDYRPAALPENAVPAIFSLDTELGLWLPIPTRMDEERGQLVGTTDHFTSFTTALTTTIRGAEPGAQWLRFQAERAVGARVDAAECGSGPPPQWVVRQDDPRGLEDPLASCLTATVDGDVELHVVVNRGYSLDLSVPVAPTAIRYAPPGNSAGIVYQTLAGDVGGPGASNVFLPARVETVLTFPRASLPTGRVDLKARATPASAAMDVVAAAGEILLKKIPDAGTALGGLVDCVGDVVKGSSSSPTRLVEALPEAVMSCAEPVFRAAGAERSVAARKVLVGVQAWVMRDRGGQTVLGASTAWQEPGEIVLEVQGSAPPPPGSARRSSVLVNSRAVRSSGTRADVPGAGAQADDAPVEGPAGPAGPVDLGPPVGRGLPPEPQPDPDACPTAPAPEGDGVRAIDPLPIDAGLPPVGS